MREVKLPSGATLKVNSAPFAAAKALYQAVLREMKHVKIDSRTELAQTVKDVFCLGFSSPEIEAALGVCLQRCQYNGGRGDLKIDEDTFEPEAARADYLPVCMEVARENLAPFVKSLYAEWERALKMIESIQA